MTNEQKRKQLVTMFGAYSKRLETLYDRFIDRLSVLAHKSGVGVEDFLEKNVLYRFGNYPELRQELNEIFSDYVQKEVLAYRAGITDGVALAYSHDSMVLSGFSILSDTALREARKTAAETFLRNRLKTSEGLNLSQLVWNYCSQTKSEFEMAVSNVLADGLKKGTSAANLGLQVRQYLSNPDMMYRRYHRTVVDAQGNKKDIVRWRRRIVDENGKVRFIEEPLEKVGRGHYRSSKRNADRLMRTEINSAYHHANSERWQTEPFVIGIMIELSPQHPVYDECDELKGRYPKDFIFAGWHPQCLCMSNPITIQGEEKKEFYRRLAAGEDMSGYVSPNRVRDIPQDAKDWIDANRDKFISAAERGKLGWVWRDNMKYVGKQFSPEELLKMGYQPSIARVKRVKTEAEKADIQRRWDERRAKNALVIKTGKNVWQVADKLEYTETIGMKSMLRNAIIKGDTIAVKEYSKHLAKSIASINSDARVLGEYIPNIKEHLKNVTISELQSVYNGIAKKVSDIESKYAGNYLKQYSKYHWEATDFLGGNMNGVQQKYPTTWKISQEAYLKLADKAKTLYDWEQISVKLKELKTFDTKSVPFSNLLGDIETAVSSKSDINIVKELLSKAEAKKKQILYDRGYYRKGKNVENIFELENVSETEAWKLINKFQNEYGDSMDNLLRPLIENDWKDLTPMERRVLTKYTQTYSYLNEPLRGIRYYGDRIWAEFEKDMPILESAIDKLKMPTNTVVRRGVNDFPIKTLGKNLREVNVGDEFVDGGFLSTSVKVNEGFFKEFDLVIVVPKNARGAYAEPFTHFNDSNCYSFNGTLWNGTDKKTFGGEREWIGQRGSKFRVLKKEGDTIYLQMIGQKYEVASDYRQYF